MIVLILCAALGLAIIGAVVWALLRHRDLPRIERVALGLLAGGVLWGGWNRLGGAALGMGDVVFLAGVLLLLWRFFFHHPRIGVSV